MAPIKWLDNERVSIIRPFGPDNGCFYAFVFEIAKDFLPQILVLGKEGHDNLCIGHVVLDLREATRIDGQVK